MKSWSCLIVLIILLLINLIYLGRPSLVSFVTCVQESPLKDRSSPSHHGLRAIVTGLEHSGTTLVTYLLYNAPCVIGAFETGYLLAGEPKLIENIQPWYRWNLASTNTLDLNYRLTLEDVDAMKKADNFLDICTVFSVKDRTFLTNFMMTITVQSPMTWLIRLLFT